jgi:hypothetical protein
MGSFSPPLGINKPGCIVLPSTADKVLVVVEEEDNGEADEEISDSPH